MPLLRLRSLFFMAWNAMALAQPENRIQKFMAEASIPGMFVAVVQADSVLYEKCFGLADVGNNLPMTSSTCMELGSISKFMTAEVIYHLQSKGLLKIQDPISKYLSQAPVSWSEITIQHLLSHTSGIANYLLDPGFHAMEYFTNADDDAAARFFNTITTDSMVQLFYSLPLEFNPGFTWSYSNTGYYLLGKIGEAATGKPFFDLVKEIVTEPLQMFQTKANELSASEGCLAKAYFIKDSSLAPARILNSNYAFSAGAWATSGHDMVSYLKALHKRNLPSDQIGIDFRKAPYGNRLPYTYNAGRFYTTFHGQHIISHNGGTPGFSSSWIYLLEKNTSIIVLINRQDYAAIDQLAWDILSSYCPSLKYPQKKRSGAEVKMMTKKIMTILDAIKNNKPVPAGLSSSLKFFLESENGKGYWKWYFERGFPLSAQCVDVEQIGKERLYRFLLPLSETTWYQLSALTNENGEWMQIRWW